MLPVSPKVQSDGRSEAPRVARKSESPGVNVREQTKNTFSNPNEIARTQLVRFKRLPNHAGENFKATPFMQ